MIQELFIENNPVDLDKTMSTLITYSIDDVKDFSSRNTAFSKTIVLPGTAKNNALLGNIFDVKISNTYDSSNSNIGSNFNPSVSANCIILQNRIQVFKGVIRLLEVIVDNGFVEYEVAVFGDLGGLMPSIGSGKLEDLDFSSYNHTWNFTNVTGSWDATPGSGYFYPLIDYGGVSTNKIDYDIRALRPALYVKEYIDKIFEEAGYTYDCDLFNTTRFKKLIIPNVQKNLVKLTTSAIGGTASTQVASPTSGHIMTFGTVTGALFTYSAGVFTYAGAVSSSVDFSINFGSAIIPFSPGDFTSFQVKKNGTDIIYSDFRTVATNSYIASFSASFTTGDTLEFIWSTNAAPGNLRVSGTFSGSTQTAVAVNLLPGETVDLNSTIPKNTKQIDFVTSIVKLFNLYIYEDKYTSKKLFIKPYVDFYDLNVSGIVDWTYKLDRSKPYRLKPMSELNFRSYNFSFKEDSDYYNELYKKTYNETYGNYLYDSQFEFAQDKIDIQLIFSPSVLVGYSGVDKIVCAFYKKNSGIEERADLNIRILQSGKITLVDSWAIKDGTSTLGTTTNYGYAGHYDDPDAPGNDIHFGVPKQLYFTLASGAVNVTQFNVYWSPYMAEITDKDSKLLTGYFKITESDINSLDFSRLIFCDGSYWVLNKIEDYNASEPDNCKVELLKRINLLY